MTRDDVSNQATCDHAGYETEIGIPWFTPPSTRHLQRPARSEIGVSGRYSASEKHGAHATGRTPNEVNSLQPVQPAQHAAIHPPLFYHTPQLRADAQPPAGFLADCCAFCAVVSNRTCDSNVKGSLGGLAKLRATDLVTNPSPKSLLQEARRCTMQDTSCEPGLRGLDGSEALQMGTPGYLFPGLSLA